MTLKATYNCKSADLPDGGFTLDLTFDENRNATAELFFKGDSIKLNEDAMIGLYLLFRDTLEFESLLSEGSAKVRQVEVGGVTLIDDDFDLNALLFGKDTLQ